MDNLKTEKYINSSDDEEADENEALLRVQNQRTEELPVVAE